MPARGASSFTMTDDVLDFDGTKKILVCQGLKTGAKRWAAKIQDIIAVDDIIEDGDHYYCSCVSDINTGYYLALRKENGETRWFIPGRAFFHAVFMNDLYVIFIDAGETFYLLKIDRGDGSKKWHHRVSDDLASYSFIGGRLVLEYASGRSERINLIDGSVT